MNTLTQPVAHTARRWLTFVLDLLYPLRCGGCGTAGQGVWCGTCAAQVTRLYPPLLTKLLPLDDPWTGTPLAVSSAALYRAPLREAIHVFKYDSTPALAEPFALMLEEAWALGALQADVIVPVPLHPRRKRERGYNQSELLARALGQRVGVAVATDLLRRVRFTDQQVFLSPEERQANVLGAFAASREQLQGRRVVLVDDVFTTGSTLRECAKALWNAGAHSVAALTLARAG